MNITLFYDVIGTLLSLSSTYFFIRANTMAWPVGFAAASLNGYLYFRQGIYGDMCIEIIYLLTMIVGWYLWKYGEKDKHFKPLKRLTHKEWVYLMIGSMLLYEITLTVLNTLTHSNVAKMDALTTALSIIAESLMCYKITATWVIWFFVDAVYIKLYLQKQLPYHAILMVVYLGMAVAGYLYWIKRPLILYPSNNLG